MDPIPSDRLKNLEDIGKWSSFYLYPSVRECQYFERLSCTCAVGWVKQHFDSMWRYKCKNMTWLLWIYLYRILKLLMHYEITRSVYTFGETIGRL